MNNTIATNTITNPSKTMTVMTIPTIIIKGFGPSSLLGLLLSEDTGSIIFVALATSRDVEASIAKGIEVILIRPSSASDEVSRGVEVTLIIRPSFVSDEMMHVVSESD